jgi:hypothetical protein
MPLATEPGITQAVATETAAKTPMEVWQVCGIREGLDPVRAGGRVVDRAEHEMKSPEHFVTREFGQAFAKRVDKLATRGVEILGHKLVEQFGIFRCQNRA